MAIPDAFRPLGRMASNSNGNSFPISVATPFTVTEIDFTTGLIPTVDVTGIAFAHFRVTYNSDCIVFNVDNTPRLFMVTINNIGGTQGFSVNGPNLSSLWTTVQNGIPTLIYHDGNGGIFNVSYTSGAHTGSGEN